MWMPKITIYICIHWNLASSFLHVHRCKQFCVDLSQAARKKSRFWPLEAQNRSFWWSKHSARSAFPPSNDCATHDRDVCQVRTRRARSASVLLYRCELYITKKRRTRGLFDLKQGQFWLKIPSAIDIFTASRARHAQPHHLSYALESGALSARVPASIRAL